MSILTEAVEKKISWSDAAKKVDVWEGQVLAAHPTLAAMLGQQATIVKQGLSNAVAYADTALAGHMSTLTAASETAADAALLSLTGGKFPPDMLPLVNGTIDQLEAAGAAAFHTWALAMKAKLAAQATASAPGSQASLALAPPVTDPAKVATGTGA